MKKEDADKIKCDRCGAVIGLYRHESGWRCPECIWKEQKKLITAARTACDEADLDSMEGYSIVLSEFLSEIEDAIDEIEMT